MSRQYLRIVVDPAASLSTADVNAKLFKEQLDSSKHLVWFHRGPPSPRLDRSNFCSIRFQTTGCVDRRWHQRRERYSYV